MAQTYFQRQLNRNRVNNASVPPPDIDDPYGGGILAPHQVIALTYGITEDEARQWYFNLQDQYTIEEWVAMCKNGLVEGDGNIKIPEDDNNKKGGGSGGGGGGSSKKDEKTSLFTTKNILIFAGIVLVIYYLTKKK